ncbi:MAG: electron transfer flavoprotein subunit alpha/FixB family protein, partial [Hyphomicrobiales bacterium]|nr:electron transfer flavoprotein subunit alpha/FixB family protein [Hyphomicrobiales bacterium]
MAALVIAEHSNAALNEATHKAVSAASALGGPVHVLVAGQNAGTAASAAAGIAGVAKVLHADGADYAHQLAEPMSALIVSLAGAYDAIVFPATANGKNIAPRVAALLDVQVISGVTKVLGADSFERPIYAGNAIQTVKSRDAKKVISIMTASFQTAGTGGSAAVETVAGPGATPGSKFLSEEVSKSDRPELASAKIVVSGGRALASAENFKTYIEPLADKLGAAVGASRAAVDAGYAPNDWQVGQTG